VVTLARIVELDCYTCRSTLDTDAPDRERVLLTEHWRAAHAFDTGLPGWLILAPTSHVASLDQLTPEAPAELGTILRNLTAALRAVTGCVKTYVLLVAEKPGFAHLHFHVVPRAADISDNYKGPGIFGLLSVSPDQQVPFAEQDRIANAVRRELVIQEA
jgi:diadenosine tetraphosphate (Ap4A) HIT family hydrolase